MEPKDFSLEVIKELIAAVGDNRIGKLKLKQGDFSLEIRGVETGQPVPDRSPTTEAPQSLPGTTPVVDKLPSVSEGTVVSSPIIGTFYQSAAPDKPAYVQVGTKVEQGDVLFIIESMKLMNEVVSELTGTVTAIHVEDAAAVEYGQPILTIL